MIRFEIDFPAWIWYVVAIYFATKTIEVIFDIIKKRQSNKLMKLELEKYENHGKGKD